MWNLKKQSSCRMETPHFTAKVPAWYRALCASSSQFSMRRQIVHWTCVASKLPDQPRRPGQKVPDRRQTRSKSQAKWWDLPAGGAKCRLWRDRHEKHWVEFQLAEQVSRARLVGDIAETVASITEIKLGVQSESTFRDALD